jgi:hypothetical protein
MIRNPNPNREGWQTCLTGWVPKPLDKHRYILYNISMENETEPEGRKRGRVAADAARVKTTLLLDLDTVEWGKHQPGGLSELIRQLLRQAYETGKKENTK